MVSRLGDGVLAWSDYILLLWQAVAEGVLAWNYKSEPRRYQLIDPATGTTIRTFAAEESPWKHTSPVKFKPVHLPQPATLKREERNLLPPEIGRASCREGVCQYV